MDGRIIGVGSTYTSKLCNAGVGLIGPAEMKEYFFVSCYIDPFMLPLNAISIVCTSRLSRLT